MSILDGHTKRHQYMADHLRMTIAFQIRLLRLQREWTQAELAKRCGTGRSAIARLEDWDSEFPSVETLRKVAAAFDCALLIKFDGWEELIATLIPSREEETLFQETKP